MVINEYESQCRHAREDGQAGRFKSHLLIEMSNEQRYDHPPTKITGSTVYQRLSQRQSRISLMFFCS